MNLQDCLLIDKNIETITYHDNKISYRIKDNYVNATMMCQVGNKSVSEWLRYDATQDYINTLEIELGLNNLVQIGLGSPRNGGGYWIHPSLILELARWIDNEEFIYWCESKLFTNKIAELRLVA
jgi:hypothetical protein